MDYCTTGGRSEGAVGCREFFTLGYQLRDLEEFIQELCVARIDLVVDVREMPWSRKRGFSKTALKDGLRAVGIAYRHARFAGNPKELRRAASSHNDCLEKYAAYLDCQPTILEELTRLLEEESARRVCFVCYERHPDDCHRTILLDRWRKTLRRPVRVKHLAPSGAPRLAGV